MPQSLAHVALLVRDYDEVAKRVEFVRAPVVALYGKVAVFPDLCGNRWISSSDGPEGGALSP